MKKLLWLPSDKIKDLFRRTKHCRNTKNIFYLYKISAVKYTCRLPLVTFFGLRINKHYHALPEWAGRIIKITPWR
jgi:hypothetical protein